MGNDFTLDSEGYCFLCLNNISAIFSQIKLDPDSEPKSCSSQSVHSLQYLSRYLKLDMRKLFNEEVPISPDLLAKVQNSKLKVELCEGCSPLNKSFLKLYRKLEKIQMELTSCVGRIRGKLVEANDAGKMAQIKRTKTKHGYDHLGRGTLDGKLGVVEALRNEAIQKCSSKVTSQQGITPRVKVKNMTVKQVLQEKQKMKASSRKNFTNYRTEQLFGAVPSWDMETGHVDPELRPDHDNDYDFEDENLNMQNDYEDDTAAAKNIQRVKEEEESVNIARDTNVIASTLSSKMEVSKSHSGFNSETGKTRCLLCSKEFNWAGDFKRHYQSAHLKVRYKCNLCGIEFSYSKTYKRHHRTVHSGSRFKCQACKQDFIRKDHLIEHQKTKGCGSEKEGNGLF